MRPQKVLFLIADGGRARLVQRSAETGGYVTLKELSAPRARRSGEKVAVFQSFGFGRSTTEPSPDARARSNADFLKEVGRLATDTAAAGGCDGLVLVAPARLMKTLRLSVKGVTVIGELAKDLTKTPNHELAGWLRPAELNGTRVPSTMRSGESPDR